MIDNLEDGGGVLGAMALYEWITLKPPQEAAKHIQQLARDNNKKLF